MNIDLTPNYDIGKVHDVYNKETKKLKTYIQRY
jgi:hypothetical protein